MVTLKNCGPLTANMISYLVGQSIDDAVEHDDQDDYSDVSDEVSDDSQCVSPTPAAAKNRDSLQRGEKVFSRSTGSGRCLSQRRHTGRF